MSSLVDVLWRLRKEGMAHVTTAFAQATVAGGIVVHFKDLDLGYLAGGLLTLAWVGDALIVN